MEILAVVNSEKTKPIQTQFANAANSTRQWDEKESVKNKLRCFDRYIGDRTENCGIGLFSKPIFGGENAAGTRRNGNF